MLMKDSVLKVNQIVFHFGLQARLRLVQNKKPRHEKCLGLLVAGAGFEPTTFGL